MVSVSVDVSLEEWERYLLDRLAKLLVLIGVLSGAVHLVTPHWLLPYTAAFGLVVGLGLGLSLDDEGEDEDEDEGDQNSVADAPLPAQLGFVATLVGLATLALGATTPQPFVEVASGGFAALIVGIIVTAYFDPATEFDDENDSGRVPDDPTEILEDGGEE